TACTQSYIMITPRVDLDRYGILCERAQVAFFGGGELCVLKVVVMLCRLTCVAHTLLHAFTLIDGSSLLCVCVCVSVCVCVCMCVCIRSAGQRADLPAKL